MRGLQASKYPSFRLVATALLAVGLILVTSGEADAAGSYVDFDAYETQRALASGREAGVVVQKTSGGGVVRLASGKTRGTLTLKPRATATRFDTLVPSWNVSTPSGTWIRAQVRVRSGGRWTGWFDVGVWAKATGTVRRHSTDGQRSGDWRVFTDTIQSQGRVFADAYQYRVELRSNKEGRTPRLRALFTTASDSYRHGEFLGVAGKRFLGTDLAVPQRSQMIYPDGGEVWCSPTSLSMVMAYWANKTGRGALDRSVPTVARGTYDYTYRGNGNWPFNTAYASEYGLKASVNRFSSLGQVERWVAKGVPVVVSISWNNNSASRRLTGAPIPVSAGHLLVVRGFDREGQDVIVNDPAASTNAGVRREYDRAEFARAWFDNPNSSGGIAYLVHPKSWPVPARTDAKGSW